MSEIDTAVMNVARRIERTARICRAIGELGMLVIIVAFVIWGFILLTIIAEVFINIYLPEPVNPFVAIPITYFQWMFIAGLVLMVLGLLKYPREEYDPVGGLKQIDKKIHTLERKIIPFDKRITLNIEEKRDKNHKETYEIRIKKLKKRKAAIELITRIQEDRIEKKEGEQDRINGGINHH